MKSKRIYLFLFAVALFAIMLFANTTDVNAATSYSNTDLYVRTTIERWNNAHNDLKFIKNDNWGGSGSNDWYTKTVWLTESTSGDPNVNGHSVQITTDMLDSNGQISFGNSVFDDFNDGGELKNIYLVEKYTINTNSSNFSYTVGEWNTDKSLPCRDRLDFGFDYSEGIARTIKETSMNNYNPDSSYTLYIKALYDSENVTTNRNLNVYFNLEESSTKTTEKSQGIINLPLYAIKADLTASGNAVEAGWFAEDQYYNNYLGVNVSSSIGRISGYLTDGTSNNGSSTNFGNENLCGWDYDGINNVSTSNFGWYYYWGTDDYGEASGAGNYESINGGTLSSLSADNNFTNTYIRTYTNSYTNNQTAPNGIFFNILPFAIAGLIAVAGIVILKKNSIK